MNKKFKIILISSIILALVDYIIKTFITSNMIVNQSNIIIKNFFSFTLVYNTGAAFSLFSNSHIFLIIIGILAITIISLYIIKLDNISDTDVFKYSLLLGGILGNLIDRIKYGYVIDYLSFNIKTYYFPIFNFADILIVISVLMILINEIKEDVWK